MVSLKLGQAGPQGRRFLRIGNGCEQMFDSSSQKSFAVQEFMRAGKKDKPTRFAAANICKHQLLAAGYH